MDLNNRSKGRIAILSELNFSSIFENTNDSVWAIDTSYDVLYANHIFSFAFLHNFGVDLKPGVNLLQSLPAPLQSVWKTRYDRALNGESFSFIDHVVAGDVSLYIEVFMNPIVHNEEIVGALFFGKDITQRKLSEKALLESQLLLKASLESQTDTILFSIDKEYNYLYFNSAHFKVMKFAYGVDIEEGMNILSCITCEDDRLEAKKNYDRALGGESHSNIREYGKDNQAFFESFFNPILNENKEVIGVTGLARDITQRRNAELAILESEQQLKELNKAKDKILSIIGHDLRSPFNNIIGFSELLLEKINDPKFDGAERYLHIINSAASNTLVLLDNLLNWAKSQTRQLSFNPVTINISEIIHEVLRLEKSLARAINIKFNYVSVNQIRVAGDENMLKIVIRNLISNAIKFTHKGGEIRIFVSDEGGKVTVTVSDNGVGISPVKQKNLFVISSENHSVGTANEKGSGLGLVLCKELVEKHNGKIWVESEEGKGSDFNFTIPKGSFRY